MRPLSATLRCALATSPQLNSTRGSASQRRRGTTATTSTARTPGSWPSQSPRGSFNSLRDIAQSGGQLDIVLAWTIVIYLAAFLLLGLFARFTMNLIKQHKDIYPLLYAMEE